MAQEKEFSEGLNFVLMFFRYVSNRVNEEKPTIRILLSHINESIDMERAYDLWNKVYIN